MRKISLWMLLSACLAFFGQAVQAQIDVTTGAQTYPAGQNILDSWYFDVDYGSTPVSVTVSIELTCTSQDGCVVILHDVTNMSKAANDAAWQASRPGVQFNLTGQTVPATTGLLGFYGAGAQAPFVPSVVTMQGVNRYFFTVRNFTNPPLANNTITVRFTTNVGTNVTPTGGGFGASSGLFYDNWTSAPVGASGTVGASSVYQRHYCNQVLGVHTHGSASDNVQYEMDVSFPTPAASTDVSIRGVAAAGVTGSLDIELYDMNAGGGSVFQTTITIANGVTDCKTITTASLSGTRKFRVIVRAGTGFGTTPAWLCNFYVTWGSNCSLLAASAQAIAATPPVQLTTPSPAAGALPAGTTGTAYPTQNFAATGGGGAPTAYLWGVGTGSLPPGLVIAAGPAATSTLSGTPTVAGTYNFTVRASNTATGFSSEFNERAYSIVVSTGSGTPTLTVNPTGTITVPTTTAGTAGTAASFTVSGSNLTPASANVTLALTSTPAGIEFRNATAGGTFGTGNITIAYSGGAFAAQTIEVRFASTATAGSYTGSIAITGGSATAVNVPLSGTVTATGTPTLTVNPGGTLTVPTTTAGTAGTTVSFTVSGSNLTPASANVTLALTSTPAGIEFRNATAGGTFGTGNITIAYTGGAFAAQTIEVRFASTATAGSYTGSIAITGGGATAVNVPLSGTVTAAGGLTITTGTLPNGVVGTPYNATITSTGGTGTHTWSVSAGSLPPGLSLTGGTAATTSISGTPTTAGTFNFTIQVAAGTQSDTQAYSVTITTSGGGGGPIGGGGGGGGGCSVEGGDLPWYLLAGLASLLVLALRRRRQTA